MIIARTDAIAVNGYEDAIDRAVAYKEAGADVIFVEALQNQEQVEKTADLVKAPLFANMVEHGKTPLDTAENLFKMGFRIAIYPVVTLYAATKGVTKVLEVLKETEDLRQCMEYEVDFPDLQPDDRAAGDKGAGEVVYGRQLLRWQVRGWQRMLSLIIVLSIFVAVAIGYKAKINVGIIAIAFAYIFGVFVLEWTAETLSICGRQASFSLS